MKKYRSQENDNPYFDERRLHALQIMLVARLDDLLPELGVSLQRSNKMFFGSCPVHGGDNPGALNLYHNGETVPGFWKCNTWHCERYFKKTIIGFIRGVLSHQQFSWQPNKKGQTPSRQVSFVEAVRWGCKFLDTSIDQIEIDYDELEKKQFTAGVLALTRDVKQKSDGLSRKQVRQHLEIPPDYYLNRGYTSEILDKYDVGLYPYKGKPLSDRVAVPVYDNNHKVAVGFTGRSVYEQCSKCERWHSKDEECPNKLDKETWTRTAKWINHDLNKESYLYNYWYAKEHIKECGIAILVEGQGEIWKLEEAGINIGLGMFGVELSEQQQVLLEMSGAMNLIVALNNDEAGREAFKDIKERLSRSFRIHQLHLSANDFGEMSIEQVKETVHPLLNRIKERGY